MEIATNCSWPGGGGGLTLLVGGGGGERLMTTTQLKPVFVWWQKSLSHQTNPKCWAARAVSGCGRLP
jgi:hypothetical protein